MSITGITQESIVRSDGAGAQKSLRRRLLMRRWIDKAATRFIGLGGASIILAVLLIFVFLFLEIVPMFSQAKVEPLGNGSLVAEQESLIALDSDDRGEVLLRVLDGKQGPEMVLSGLGDDLKAQAQLKLPYESDSQWIYDPISGYYVVETDGVVHFGTLAEKEVYSDDSRRVEPILKQNSPEEGFTLVDSATEITLLQVKALSNAIALSYLDVSDPSNPKTFLQVWKKARGFLAAKSTYKPKAVYELPLESAPDSVYIDNQLKWAYAIDKKGISLVRLRGEKPLLYSAVAIDGGVTASSMLLGSKSILIGDNEGGIGQWSLIRDDNNAYELKELRRLQLGTAPIRWIQPEDRRRGFYALDDAGELGIFFTTSERKLKQWTLEGLDIANTRLISTPRSNTLIAYDTEQFKAFSIKNDHPEVSFKSMWQKIWYEGYEDPEYIWQSSAATNDFEPKLSLAPLAYGTLKATFYAMLFALPLAICGAIYTAYFMATPVRKKVKPCIEFMEALPTVILGFLAGIWLAPLVETYLPGVLLTLISLPVVMLLVSLFWYFLPKNLRYLVPEGWEPVILAPFIVLTVLGCFALSQPLEAFFFAGNAKIWMRDTLGIAYDQRNSLVVGIAMGFAVIPTIFSIAEDAVFAVPKSLTFGSLALGASPWQTLVRVVLPTASPGIFSAVMIGSGRAVGETMIVLMATGSTPIMDMNIFEGFRTLSANIAIEMPEAEVHSTHYRLLFFAAFCLFMFTFVFNTTAEIVRQRLREKYGSL